MNKVFYCYKDFETKKCNAKLKVKIQQMISTTTDKLNNY